MARDIVQKIMEKKLNLFGHNVVFGIVGVKQNRKAMKKMDR